VFFLWVGIFNLMIVALAAWLTVLP